MTERHHCRDSQPSPSDLRNLVEIIADSGKRLIQTSLLAGLMVLTVACASSPNPGSLPVDPTPVAQNDLPIGGSASVVYAPAGCPAAGSVVCDTHGGAIARKTASTSPQ
jgi:hypothetical protein